MSSIPRNTNRLVEESGIFDRRVKHELSAWREHPLLLRNRLHFRALSGHRSCRRLTDRPSGQVRCGILHRRGHAAAVDPCQVEAEALFQSVDLLLLLLDPRCLLCDQLALRI